MRASILTLKHLFLLIGILASFLMQPALQAENSSPSESEPVIFRLGSVCVESPWAFDSLGKKVGAAFMAVSAQRGHTDRLVSAQSQQATRVEIHDIVMSDGMMTMEKAQNEVLTFSSESPLALEPHGLHVMLMGLDNPLTPESELQLTLEFEKSGTIDLAVAVRELSNTPIMYVMVCE